MRKPIPAFFTVSLLLAALALAGCSGMSGALNALNPFASSEKPKMAALPAFAEQASLHSLWRYSIGKAGNAVFYPAIVEGVVFVASEDGNIARLENGVEKWRVKAGKKLSAGVGSNGDLVVVGTERGDVLAFSAADGSPLWQARASSEILVPPLVDTDMVIIKSGNNQIDAFDLAGKRKWFYQRPPPTLALRNTAPMLLSSQFILTGFPGGKLVALSLQNGVAVWEGTVAQPKGATEIERVADVVSPPAVNRNIGCAVAFQGRVTCFDFAQGGNSLWSRDISSWAGLAVDNQSVFVSDDESVLRALDLHSGNTLWDMNQLLRRNLTAPQVFSDYLVVGDTEGYVHLIERTAGKLAGRARIGSSPIRVSPAQLSGDTILVQTSDGAIEALEIR